MSLFWFFLRRAGQLTLLVFLVVSASFLLSALIPGDFFTRHSVDPAISAETLQHMRHRYGLDQSLSRQYVQWLRNSLHLDLGYSLCYGRPVAPVVIDGVAKTLWISLPALLVGIAGGILLGTIHGIWAGRMAGRLLDVISTLALSLPTLVLGLGALILAARTQWFPLGSMSSTVAQNVPYWEWLIDRAHHLVLPAACLTIPVLASIERIQATATHDTLQSLWVRSARARGLAARTVYLRHLLLPALNSVISVSGPMLGAVLSGSLILEVIFSWPGLGRIMYDALLNNDLHLLVGGTAAGAVLLVAGNMITDLLLFALDPRTRHFSQEGSL